nr:MAG TPA: resistance protein [Caudoviricetes sp.]
MTLYELSNEYREFLAALEAGEIPEEAVPDTLEGLDGLFDDKAEAVGLIVKELDANVCAMKEEAKKLMDRAKAKENKAESLRRYLIWAMQSAGKTKLETPRVSLSIPKPRATVSVSPYFTEWAQENGHEDLLIYKPAEPSKTAIKAALLDGLACPYAEIIEGRKTINIK